ncbi:MAG: glycosyltransferase family 4 protein [Nitrospirae bacterium]|nr:glycosyltransferase family 4 protein [Nitrospirota bacterium]
MRILLCTHDFPPQVGGIQTYSYEVARGLSSWGEEVTVLAPGTEGDIEFDREQVFPVIRAKSKIGLYLKFFWILWRKRIEKILVAHRADYAALASWAHRLWGIDYYIVAHGGEVLLPWRRKSIRENFKRARRILAVSHFTARELVRIGIPEEKITVIPNGVDPERFKPGIDSSSLKEKFNLFDRKVILTVSHLVKRKGHRKIIQALPKVLERVPEAVYLIVGEGPEEDGLRQLARHYGVERQVIFAGYVSSEELPLCYNAGDVFIMTSREIEEEGDFEGFGIVFLEANACGKPVIGGRSGGVKDAVIEGETGLLTDPLNHEEIAAALIRLLTEESLAENLGEKGRKRIEKELSWRTISQRILRELEQ